jgi:hypothetical protein
VSLAEDTNRFSAKSRANVLSIAYELQRNARGIFIVVQPQFFEPLSVENGWSRKHNGDLIYGVM